MITCARCQERPAVSVAMGVCSYCLYLESMGAEAADRQERATLEQLKRTNPAGYRRLTQDRQARKDNRK